ncbi:MAG: hypothetical protein WCH59_01115 [Chitinophagia bacterium]|jgi:hypothetical protein
MFDLYIKKLGNIPIRLIICFLFTTTVFFPFIPVVISSTDTQPTFFLLSITTISIFLISPHFYSNYLKEDYSILVYVFLIIFCSLLSIVLNSFLYGQFVIIPRYISFLQFLAAFIFGYTNSFDFFKKYAKTIFFIYFIFTFIYFFTNGAVENLLIRSRVFAEGQDLASMGRGSRTLSPEPSFFATQMFNLYLIYLLLLEKQGDLAIFNNKRILFMVCFCLLSSLSGYGFVIFFIILSAFFTQYFIVFLSLAIIFNSLIFELLSDYSYLRGIGLVLKVIQNNPAILLTTDASFASRFSSFFAYIDRFGNNLLIGDGFSLLQGGGFISILASLGIMGVIMLLSFFIKIFTAIRNRKLKYLLVFWFFLNFFSGPIGIPAIGIILGLIIRPVCSKEISYANV